MSETGKAIGFIETRGFVGCVEAADQMLKSASVTLQGYKKTVDNNTVLVLPLENEFLRYLGSSKEKR